jgi:hemolysin III
MNQKPLTKPKLRGYIHQEAFFVSVGACALLVAKSTSRITVAASLIYSAALLLLLGISAFYHRPHWAPETRAFLRRLDHAAIFLLIAGTTTPVALLALPKVHGITLLILIWGMAAVGVGKCLLWARAPRWFSISFFVATACISLPYFFLMTQFLSALQITLLLLGGAVYLAGALFYAARKPDLFPGVFGYHELFHLFTIVGAALHFSVIYSLIV